MPAPADEFTPRTRAAHRRVRPGGAGGGDTPARRARMHTARRRDSGLRLLPHRDGNHERRGRSMFLCMADSFVSGVSRNVSNWSPRGPACTRMEARARLPSLDRDLCTRQDHRIAIGLRSDSISRRRASRSEAGSPHVYARVHARTAVSASRRGGRSCRRHSPPGPLRRLAARARARFVRSRFSGRCQRVKPASGDDSRAPESPGLPSGSPAAPSSPAVRARGTGFRTR